MKRSKGALSRQTQKLKARGQPTPMDFIQSFEVGSSVVIMPRPTGRAIPPLRYSFRHGTVVEKRGESYVVEVRDQQTKKKIISHPVHLVAAGGNPKVK